MILVHSNNKNVFLRSVYSSRRKCFGKDPPRKPLKKNIGWKKLEKEYQMVVFRLNANTSSTITLAYEADITDKSRYYQLNVISVNKVKSARVNISGIELMKEPQNLMVAHNSKRVLFFPSLCKVQ